MICLKEIRKSFGDLTLFDGFDLEIPSGKVSVLLGPSGCGKTSLLNMLAGLLIPDSGTIEGIGNRRISYLFQEPRLVPWLTIRQNLEFVLEGVRGVSEGLLEKGSLRKVAEDSLARVGMADFSESYPRELSGGMRQRAVIARAFTYPGEILLMDEPLQALDLARKLDLVRWFLQLWEETAPTTLFVTHDIQEALMLGDRISVLSPPPGRFLFSADNPVPPVERRLTHPRLMELESRLYSTLIETSPED